MLRTIPFSIAFCASALFANPQHPEIRAGAVDFSQNNNLLEIRPTDGAIINWKEFSIQPHEVTRFIQSDTKARVLNRVTGSIKSSLLGVLESNGQIYLMNPHGVIIGKDAVIRTGGLFVTTFELEDDLFSKTEWVLKGDSDGAITNYGSILAGDGDVYLVAQKVQNFGKVQASGAIELAAGREILLKPKGEERIAIKPDFIEASIENEGSLEAIQIELRSAVNPYGLAIRHKGDAQAIKIVEQDGKILLCTEGMIGVDGILVADNIEILGDSVEIESKAHLTGKEITVGNERTRYVRVDEGAVLTAGDRAGNFYLWGEDVCAFNGSISMNGGFAEISSARLLMPGGKVNTNGGTLLLDPTTVTINAVSDTNLGAPLTVPPSLPPPPAPGQKYTFTAAAATILNTNLEGFLATTNVLIDTALGPGGVGDIDINAPVTWSSGFGLYLQADNNINVNDLVTATSTGLLNLTASGDIVVGTALSATPSCLKTSSGAITLSAGGNIKLNGGNALGASAEISSLTGDITISNVGMDILLNAGTAIQTYAQIGVGSVASAVNVSSNIYFGTIGNNVTLTGNSGTGSYAQIGHSPFGPLTTSTARGSIIFTSNLGAGNIISLTGGSALNASAIIGHGNLLSDHLGMCSGTFQILAEANILLNGGTNIGTHAVIGFQNPANGSAIPFVATSPLLQVSTIIFGDIGLQGGTGGNAVIGFYNDTSSGGSSTSVNITSIQLTTTLADEIRVIAGKQLAGSGGVAVIGTLDAVSNADSNITASAGQFRILGPQIGANDSAARILNQRPNVTTGNTISLNATTFTGKIEILGGTGVTPGYADIYSSGALNIEMVGNFQINDQGAFLFQTGYAHVIANGAITINTVNLGAALTVKGGSVSTADALLESLTSSISWGTVANLGGTSMTIGDPMCVAPSQILTAAGNSVFHFSNNALIQGGSIGPAPQAFALIGSTSGNIDIHSNNGTLTLNGGSAASTFAQISSNLGDVTIEFNNGSANLTGGTGVQAYAQIGVGIGTPITNVSSNINIKQINGNLMLTGGPGVGAYAQIGHSPLNGVAATSVVGNVSTDIPGGLFIAGNITLTGGNLGASSTAIIGHGNEECGYLNSVSGLIALTTTGGGVTLNPNTPAFTHTTIGLHTPYGGSSVPFMTVIPTGVSVNSEGGNITLNGNSAGTNAVIGFYNNTVAGPITNINIQNINVKAQFNTIQLNAGSGGITGGIAAIGTFVNASSSAFSNISVTGNNVVLQGPIGAFGTDNSAARIINSRPGVANASFDVSIVSTGNLDVFGGLGAITGFADIYSCHDLSIRFSLNCNINNGAALQHGYAQAVADHNVEINTVAIGNNLNLTGGNNFGAYALIEATTGHCYVGGFGPGPINITVGSAISLAPSSIVAVLDTNAVAASQAISLIGGAGTGVYAWIQNTNGPINVNAGSTLTLTGGSGTDATAQITNIMNGITLSSQSDTQLAGGTGLRSFAQIGTYSGSVLFTVIGGNLYLNNPGGMGTEAYAQIGIGRAPSLFVVNSPITINTINGDLVLQGGLGPCSYSQIGHSPYCLSMPCDLTMPCSMMPYTANGDVNIGQVSGMVSLNGGSMTNTSVTIGHGNPLSAYLNSASGAITVNDSGMVGILFNPGAGTDAHSTIGYFSPFAGSPDGFTVNSNGVSVNTTLGPISIVAQNMNNATIGYYNAATPSLVSVLISDISVSTGIFGPAPPDQVLLQADNGGPTNGIASIGTYAAAAGSVSTSAISITTFELDVLGPTAGNNGQALIYDNQPCATPPCTSCTFDPFDTVIMSTNTNVLGGTGISPGMAAIYSSQNLELDFTGTFTINSITQTLNATVTAGNNISINPTDMAGNLNIIGGAATTVMSLLNSVGGNIIFGDVTQDFPGVTQLTIGDPMMVGSARLFTCPGSGKSINLLGSSVLIQGGAANGAFADLNANGPLTITTTGNIALKAGPALNSGALINSTTGPFFVVSRSDIDLTGTPSSPASFTNDNNSFNVQATNNINILSNSTFRNNGNGATMVYAGNDVALKGMGSIINFGTGNMTVLAGHSLYAQNNSLISTNTGVMALVTDNNFPAPPGIGNGFISQDASSSFNSAGAPLRIFTARREFNTLDGSINGNAFVPGIEFINTATEIWGVYYPSTLGGFPFTVFYKDFIPTPFPNVIPASRTANYQFTQQINSYYDFIFCTVFSFLSYDREAYTVLIQPQFAIMSYEVVPDIQYSNIRRLYRNYNLKKIDTLK